MKKKKNVLLLVFTLTFLCCFTYIKSQNKPAENKISQDTLKTERLKLTTIKEVDSVFNLDGLKLKLYKKSAHASYYHDRFNGRKTANGERFSNKKYTAAHKKLPFGTKIKVTNESTGKYVIVTVTDRGPFVKTREIDLSKRAFMEIAQNKASGAMKVTIETIEN